MLDLLKDNMVSFYNVNLENLTKTMLEFMVTSKCPVSKANNEVISDIQCQIILNISRIDIYNLY